jgi:hypothetical protein
LILDEAVTFICPVGFLNTRVNVKSSLTFSFVQTPSLSQRTVFAVLEKVNFFFVESSVPVPIFVFSELVSTSYGRVTVVVAVALPL